MAPASSDPRRTPPKPRVPAFGAMKLDLQSGIQVKRLRYECPAFIRRPRIQPTPFVRAGFERRDRGRGQPGAPSFKK